MHVDLHWYIILQAADMPIQSAKSILHVALYMSDKWNERGETLIGNQEKKWACKTLEFIPVSISLKI